MLPLPLSVSVEFASMQVLQHDLPHYINLHLLHLSLIRFEVKHLFVSPLLPIKNSVQDELYKSRLFPFLHYYHNNLLKIRTGIDAAFKNTILIATYRTLSMFI